MAFKLIPREVREASWPEADLLTSEQQGQYEEAVKSRFNSQKARDSILVPGNYTRRTKGSNLFKILFLNEIGIQTATLPELDLMWTSLEGNEILKGHYEDGPEVVLRSAGDNYKPNNLLAKSLAKAIGKRKFKVPFVIKGLRPQEGDDDSDYGLSLVPNDSFQYFEAPDFDVKNNGRKFSIINPDYSIEWNDSTNRTFYAKPQGLSRVLLNTHGGLSSYWDTLAYSNYNGRVVVVSPEGARAGDLEKYFTQLTEERDRQTADLNQRYEEAKALLERK